MKLIPNSLFWLLSISLKANQVYLYVIPDFLPQGYSFEIFGEKPKQIYWVGYQIIEDGKIIWKGRKKPLWNLPFSHAIVLTCRKLTHCQKILDKPSLEKKFLENLKNLPQVQEIQFDWEYLPPHYALKYSLLLKKVKNYLAKPTILSSTLFPQVDFQENLKKFPELTSTIKEVDYLVVMLYDRHGPKTEPGCVSPLSWLEENLKFLQNFPTQKIILGAPLYGYCFSSTKVRPIKKTDFFKVALKNPPQEKNGCYEFRKEEEICFYPSEKLYESYKRALGFRGISYWRAGFEE